ncbi:hypothetical protein [Planktotalea sp.]|uniref:hypothetical protein n=1 Tax=Planktotalea sp. TaxID=2029877 RepID=UPI003D6AE9F7
MRMKCLGFAIVLGILGGAGFAGEVWECEMPAKKPTHFLAGPLIFDLNHAEMSVAVHNPMIMAIYRAPLQVRMGKNTDQVMRAWWKLKKIKTSKGTLIPELRYSATLLKKKGIVTYHLSAPIADNTLGATGKCKRTK